MHAHMDALVDLDFIFETMLETPGMHAYSEHGISSPEDMERAAIRFRYMKSDKRNYFLVLKLHESSLIRKNSSRNFDMELGLCAKHSYPSFKDSGVFPKRW